MSNSVRSQLLHDLGFDNWVKRDASVAADDRRLIDEENATGIEKKPIADTGIITAGDPVFASVVKRKVEKQSPPNVQKISLDKIRRMDTAALTTAIEQCQACMLQEKRKQVVVGSGNAQASMLIIGEAPGEQEDISGEPFVGRAGLLLNNMLASIGLDREQVFITNVVKCRPPDNRDPRVDELEACSAYLQRQIELIEPSIILVVGRIAAQHLLQTSDSVAKLRGKIHHIGASGIPLIITYHPAYLLRKPQEKQKVWIDLKFARSVSKQQG